MNWQRIWTGTAVATIVLILFDILGSRPPITMTTEVISGLMLTWLYALARPRLGPGPRTALMMGSIGFFLANQALFHTPEWKFDAWSVLLRLSFNWLKFAVATYLAGWQYIEKAP